MKRMKKVWGIFLATVLLVTMFSNTAFAAISVPKSQTIYLTRKNGTSSVSIPVNGLTKKQKITKSSVKSSNTSVLAPSSLNRNTNEYTTQYINNKSKDYSSSYVSSSIYFDAKKAGTSTITFKVGSKSYKSKVTVKKYVNPATTIIIPGVNSGKNIASKFNSDSYKSGKHTKTAKSGKIRVKAAKGWKLVRVFIDDNKLNGQGISYWSSKGVSSVSLPIAFALKAKGKYYYSFTFQNTKNKAELTLTYNTY